MRRNFRFALLMFTILLTISVILSGCKGVTGISLNYNSLKMAVGESEHLKVTAQVKNGIGKTPEVRLTWTSTDENVALVNSEGLVTANAAGNCNIICTTQDGYEASCTVTVEEEAVFEDDEENTAGGTTIINNYYDDRYDAHFDPYYEFDDDDFVFPESSVSKLSKDEIRSTLASMPGVPVTDSFAQDAINEIYARNGYIFKNKDYQRYYESKSWYYPDSGFTLDYLNSIENYNIGLLMKYR